jgi:hypothetical protein
MGIHINCDLTFGPLICKIIANFIDEHINDLGYEINCMTSTPMEALF